MLDIQALVLFKRVGWLCEFNGFELFASGIVCGWSRCHYLRRRHLRILGSRAAHRNATILFGWSRFFSAASIQDGQYRKVHRQGNDETCRRKSGGQPLLRRYHRKPDEQDNENEQGRKRTERCPQLRPCSTLFEAHDRSSDNHNGHQPDPKPRSLHVSVPV